MLKLPKVARPGKVGWQGETILFYGISGIGKTTLACQFIRAAKSGLFISPVQEEGGDYQTVPAQTVEDWGQFREVCESLRDDRREVVVIDAVHHLFQLCVEFVCINQTPPVSDPEGIGKYGRGWYIIQQEFLPWLDELRRNVGTLILTCRAKWQIVLASREITKYFPDFPSSTYGKLLDRCGIIGFMHRPVEEAVAKGEEGGTEKQRDAFSAGRTERWLYVQPSEFFEAKMRAPGVPEAIRLGKTEEMYRNFNSAFRVPVGKNGK